MLLIVIVWFDLIASGFLAQFFYLDESLLQVSQILRQDETPPLAYTNQLFGR